MSRKSKQTRVDVGPDKRSFQTRTSLAQVISTNGPKSAIWKTKPEVEGSGTTLVARGTALADAEAAVQALQSQVATALNVRDAKVVEFDAAYDVYVANVESNATTPQDVTGLGLTLFVKSSYPLAAPLGIDATFDAATRHIQIHVNKAPGMQASVVEVSSNPADPDAWRRLPGFGAVHKLSGYAPGTLWVRAASARANEMSEFTGPVAVIVK